MRFIFQSDRWRSKGIICRKAEITLRQQGKQERSARPRKRDGLPRAPLLGELSRQRPRLRGFSQNFPLKIQFIRYIIEPHYRINIHFILHREESIQ